MTDKVIKPLLCIITTIAIILILGAIWCITAESSSEWNVTRAYINKCRYYDPLIHGPAPSDCIYTYVLDITYNIQGVEYRNNLFTTHNIPVYISGETMGIMYKVSDPDIIKEYLNGVTVLGYICSIFGSTILACAGCIAYATY
jgi:hypothetical protein